MRGIVGDRDLGTIEDVLAAAGAAYERGQLRILVGRHAAEA